MEIIDKIKNILNSLEDIKTVMYESAFGANLRVDRKEAPFAIMYTVADYQLDMSRNLKEGCDIEIFFAERGKLGDTGDNDQVIIDRTMGYARQFLAVLRQEKSIVIENDPVMKSAYGRYDAHLVGVSVELQLRDRQAHCIDYEEPSIKTLTITENGEYDTTQYGKVIVNVAEPEPPVPPTPPTPTPVDGEFWMQNTSDQTGTLTITDGGGILRYSFDGDNWTDYDFTTHPTITVNAGQTVYMKGVKSNPYSNYLNLSMNVSHSIGGNLMSLVDEDNFASMTSMPNQAFRGLFHSNTHLTDASDLNLGEVTSIPSNALSLLCYNCTSLVTGPDFPNITSVGDFGLYQAFYGCSSLTNVADLSSVTTVGTYGLAQAYIYCGSLSTYADLRNITTVSNSALNNMFVNCFHLTTVYTPNDPTWGAGLNSVYHGWLLGNTNNGTLYCPSQQVADAIPDNDASGCPRGWVKQIIQ